jgi:hypothetical protein
VLTLATKSNIRRWLDYPVAGLPQIGTAGQTFGPASVGYRFFEAWGMLEYRMNNLDVDEESRLTGQPYGGVALVGLQPDLGDTFTVTIGGGTLSGPQIVTITAGAPIQGVDNRLTVIQAMAQAIIQNAVLNAAGVLAVAPYGTGPYSMNQVPLPELGLIFPSGATQSFTLAVTGTGNVAPQITNLPLPLSPSTSLDGTTTIWGYLPILDGLESAHGSASQNLDTKQAAVWYSRGNEIGLRTSLKEQWKDELAGFLGVPRNRYSLKVPQRRGAVRYA